MLRSSLVAGFSSILPGRHASANEHAFDWTKFWIAVSIDYSIFAARRQLPLPTATCRAARWVRPRGKQVIHGSAVVGDADIAIALISKDPAISKLSKLVQGQGGAVL